MKLSKFVVGLLLLMLAAGSVYAQTNGRQDYPREEVQCCTFDNIPNFEKTCTFDKVVLGPGETLVAVEICFDLAISNGQIVVDNDAPTAATVDVEFGADADISSTDVTLLDAGFNPVAGPLSAFTNDTFNLAANTGDGQGDYDPSAPDGDVLLGENVGDSDCGFINTLFLDDYVANGTNTFDILINVDQLADYGSVSGVEAGITPVNASGQVCVYYTILPEPVTLSLLGLGGMALLRRRR